MYDVTIRRGPQALAAIQEEWTVLARRMSGRRVLHALEWWHSYVLTLAQQPRLFRLAVVRNNGSPIAILPLEGRARRRFGWTVREIGLPEHPHLPLGDILCDPLAVTEEVFKAVQRALIAERDSWDLLTFRGVLEDSAAARALAHQPSTISIVSHTCDYLDCTRPYEAITAALSRNFRSNLNKARNKLARVPNVEFAYATEGANLSRAFDEFLEVEASGWKGSTGTATAITLHPELVHFYRALKDNLAPQGKFLVNVLRIGPQAIAAQLCVRDEETLYVLKLAYDEQWARFAPGNMLLEWVIRRAGQEPCFRYLNLVNDPPWFKDWRPASSEVRHLYLFNRTTTGFAMNVALRARQWLKACKERYAQWRQGRRRELQQPVSVRSGAAGGD